MLKLSGQATLQPSSSTNTADTMDFLKAEIAAKKRKATSAEAPESGEKETKYVRRGEEERKREEEYRERETEKRAARLERLKEEDMRRTERVQVSQGEQTSPVTALNRCVASL